MPIHRFAVNVPNPGAKPAAVRLRLEPASRRDLRSLPHGLPKGRLAVRHAGLGLDPCACEGRPMYTLKLDPRSSADIQVVIETAPARNPGFAGFNLIETRGGKDTGGVFLLCTDPAYAEPAGQVVTLPNLCTAAFAKAPYLIEEGQDPGTAAAADPASASRAFDLVAPIANAGRRPLVDARAHLEHTGASGVAFSQGIWNMGTLRPGDVFLATWTVWASPAIRGPVTATIVVGSQRANPVRLQATFSLGPARRR